MSRVSKEQQREEKQRQKHFEVNQKYFTICCYTVVTFVICLFISLQETGLRQNPDLHPLPGFLHPFY